MNLDEIILKETSAWTDEERDLIIEANRQHSEQWNAKELAGSKKRVALKDTPAAKGPELDLGALL